MKITIEYYNVANSVEFKDFDIHEFTDHLRKLLHAVWLPDQVDQILPTEESLDDEAKEARRTGYDEGHVDGYNDGYTKGLDENSKSTQVIFDEGYEEGFDAGKEEGFDKGREYGYKEGLAFKGNDKDSERLDWLLEDCELQYWAKELTILPPATREEIDKAMEDSQ